MSAPVSSPMKSASLPARTHHAAPSPEASRSHFTDGNPGQIRQQNRFDRVFWKRLWKLARPYWESNQKRIAFGLLGTTLLLSSATKGGSVVVSYVNRDMMTALADRNGAEFFHQMLLILIYSVIAAPITAIDGYIVGRLIIRWRQWLTEQFLSRSFRDRAFYRISSDVAIDNPDQRISEDLNAFAGFTVTFVLQVLWGLVTGASFLVVLWFISPKLTGILVACVVAGSVLTIAIGRPLIGINFAQRRREADFRHALVHVRDNAEAIALYGGEEDEKGRLLQRLYAAIENNNLLILWQRNLAFFTYTYDFLLVLVPFAVLAPSFFAGKIPFGQITQAGVAFLALRTALSIIVDQFNSLSTFAAVVERLGGYLDAADGQKGLPAVPTTAEENATHAATLEGNRFAIEALTLRTPDRRKVLIRELSCEIIGDKGLLIIGESGVGKTSLLRAIAGLGPTWDGRILRPPLTQMMFLPQRPYLIRGSLRDQLCYPHAKDVTDAALLAVLQQVKLDDLPERVGGFDTELEWKDLLSLGQQQQIAFVRVLINHPAYAFLDEATGALDPDSEALLYHALISARITLVSVGKPALRKFHGTVLELLGDGNWRITNSGSIAITSSGTRRGE
jgi:putative ATP-binding cassette transporter